jgi:hypothetical protein
MAYKVGQTSIALDTPDIPLFKQFKESIDAASKVQTSKAQTSKAPTP